MPLAQLARFREATYRLLSQMFLYPDEERVAAIAAAANELWQERAALARFAFFGRWSHLLCFLKDLGQRRLEDIQSRYISIFVVNPAGVPCPPYESVYREPAGRPTGWLLAQVEREYATAGLGPKAEKRELPDHVAVETEYLGVLCGREAEAWEEKNRAAGTEAVRRQNAFLDRHLALWFPDFAGQVVAADISGVYATVSEAAQAFISHDGDLLGALLEMLSAGDRGLAEVRSASNGSR